MNFGKWMAVCVAGVCGAVGCEDSKKNESSVSQGSKEKSGSGSGHNRVLPEMPDDFKEFDLEGILSRWQGAWVVSNQGRQEAWEVKGDRVTVWNGREEQEHGFVVYSPCQVGVLRESDRGQSIDLVNFSLDGDAMQAGTASNAGYRTGDRMAACTTDGVWIGKGDRCVLWKKELGDGAMVWATEDAECGTLTKPEYGDFVTLKSSSKSMGTELKISGGALISGRLQPLEKHVSFGDAKAKLAP